MTDRPRPTPRPAGTDGPRSSDQIEQHQRADGSWDVGEDDTDAGTPVTPDVLEQRQGVGDSAGTSAWRDVPADRPITPDVLEQHQVVEEDPDEHRGD